MPKLSTITSKFSNPGKLFSQPRSKKRQRRYFMAKKESERERRGQKVGSINGGRHSLSASFFKKKLSKEKASQNRV